MTSTTPFLLAISLILFISVHATTFNVINKCTYTVWAAASPGGGKQLNTGKSWQFPIAAGTQMARVWGRTGCKFDASGQGQCDTGNCAGGLQCTGWGSPPNTVAEYTLAKPNNPTVTIDISVVDGFNIPMDFSPTTGVCKNPNKTILGVSCAVDLIAGCPAPLKTTGGCNNPCTVFKTDEYCCTPESGSCSPTNYSRYFKQKCPNAYSYPKDDVTSAFTCPADSNFIITFCPQKASAPEGQASPSGQLPLINITMVYEGALGDFSDLSSAPATWTHALFSPLIAGALFILPAICQYLF